MLSAATEWPPGWSGWSGLGAARDGSGRTAITTDKYDGDEDGDGEGHSSGAHQS